MIFGYLHRYYLSILSPNESAGLMGHISLQVRRDPHLDPKNENCKVDLKYTTMNMPWADSILWSVKIKYEENHSLY